ncbi:MAG TPA: radical SAM protein, partial [Thermobifida alba]|nr:radical SAM protein [Thermobifida alba]
MTTLYSHPVAAPPADSPYRSYVYGYPHKTAYRPLADAPRLADVWRDEPTDALSLYFHIPFCEVRCGFCNLFTRSTPPAEQVTAYLEALTRQTAAVAEALGGTARFARAALGGGTPTYLTAAELHRLYDLAEHLLGVDLATIPTSVETSPATATPDRLAVLAARGATRISIGVQSFVDAEAHAAGRPQRRADVDRALAAIREHAPAARLNIDLIYGIAGQTPDSWRHSLDTALAHRPEELYLYP